MITLEQFDNLYNKHLDTRKKKLEQNVKDILENVDKQLNNAAIFRGSSCLEVSSITTLAIISTTGYTSDEIIKATKLLEEAGWNVGLGHGTLEIHKP